MAEEKSKSLTLAKQPRSAGLNISLDDTRQAAQYIADMTLELRNLAKANKLLTLQGLLEVAFYEAFGAAVQKEIPEGEAEHLRMLSRASEG
jgi:hypothetical protein